MKKQTNTDELIAQARAGSPKAFAELAARYRPMLDKACYKRAGETVSMDELHQAALIGLYAAVRSYDTGNGAVTFGLYAKICVGRRIESELRRSKADDSPLPDDEPGDETAVSPEDELIARESLRQRLGDIDARLTPYESQVFRLYLEDKSYREIAGELSRTEKSVDGALRRAKAKLRRAFG